MDRRTAEELAVEHGFDPDIDPRAADVFLQITRHGPTILFDAFLALGADVNARDYSEGPPMVVAAEAGALDRIDLLIARGADLESEDRRGDTALHTAGNWGHAGLVTELARRGAHYDRLDRLRFSPLSDAAKSANVALVKALLALGADPDHGRENDVPSALVLALTNTKCTELLLEAKADPNRVVHGVPLLCWGAMRKLAAACKLLLDHGATHAADHHGWTPWMYASRDGNKPLCELLVARGAQTSDMRRLELFTAAAADNAEACVQLVESGVDVAARRSDGFDALAIAVKAKAFRAAEALLAHGARPDAMGDEGESALSMAVEAGETTWVDRLLAEGASVNDSKRNSAALISAIVGKHVGLVKRLLATGANPDSIGPHDQSAVLYAAANGDIETLELLAAAGANLDRGAEGRPAIYFATYKHQVAAIETLVRLGARVDAPDDRGNVALSDLASESGDKHAEALVAPGLALLGAGADVSRTSHIYDLTAYQHALDRQMPLAAAIRDEMTTAWLARHRHEPHFAAQVTWGQLLCFIDRGVEAVRELFDNGLTLDACNAGLHKPLLHAVKAQDPSVALLMLERGVDPDAAYLANSRFPESALGVAAGKGQIELVRAFLARGADPNLGEPLASAAAEGHLEVARLLVAAGARPTSRRGGCTPLHRAAMEGRTEVCEYLLSVGADPQVRNSMAGCPTPAEIAADEGHKDCARLLVTVTKADFTRALVAAIRAGRAAEAAALLERGADPGRPDARGDTAKSIAPLRRATAALLDVPYAPLQARRLAPEPAVFHAIYHGDSIAIGPVELALRNERGDTAVHAAVAAGNFEALERALAAGADATLPNRFGETPWSLAVSLQRNDRRFEKALLAAGASIDITTQVTVYQAILDADAAFREGDLRAIDRLLDQGSVSLHVGGAASPLVRAIASGDEDLVALLVAKGADVNARAGEWTPLLLATSRGNEAVKAILTGTSPQQCRSEVGLKGAPVEPEVQTLTALQRAGRLDRKTPLKKGAPTTKATKTTKTTKKPPATKKRASSTKSRRK